MLERVPFDALHIVFGAVNDKDLGSVLHELPVGATYYYCKADIPRGLDAEELRAQGSLHGLIGSTYPSVQAAYRAAFSAAALNDLVLITGSVFVVAEVL